MVQSEDIHSRKNNYLYIKYETDIVFPQHYHDSFEFLYVEDGEVEVYTEHVSFTLKKDFSTLILPNEIHAYQTKTTSRILFLIFSCDFVYDFSVYAKGKILKNPVFRLTYPALLQDIGKPNVSPYTIKSVLYYIVGHVCSQCEITATDFQSKQLSLIILNYIQNRFTEPITLKKMAFDIGYHYNYISAYIHANFHITFNDMLNYYRIDYACTLLRNDEWNITQIAEACGYETIRSFNGNFMKIKNVTPSQYRANLR